MRTLAFVLLLLPALGLAGAVQPFPKSEPVPGGVAVIPLPVQGNSAPKVDMGGRRIMVVSHEGQWYALAGLPFDMAPGEASLEVKAPGAVSLPVKFQVLPKEYATQSLTIADKEMVDYTPASLRRIEREQKHLNRVLEGWRKTRYPALGFIWPAQGPETSHFGVRRVLNGEARDPHSGIDIGAPQGTPLHAPADAVVADVSNFFLCGKTLTLDMGQGLYSIFCHMSIITVRPGQKVKQGQYVGRIGKTGRTTGPNLHWTVRLNGAAVDPHVFLGDNAPAVPASTAIAPSPAISLTAPVQAPAAATHRPR